MSSLSPVQCMVQLVVVAGSSPICHHDPSSPVQCSSLHGTAQYSTVQHSTEQPRNLFGAGRPRLGMVGASTRPQSSVVARLRAGEVTLGTRHHGRHGHCLRRLRGETEILALSIKQKTLKMICPLLHSGLWADCGYRYRVKYSLVQYLN